MEGERGRIVLHFILHETARSRLAVPISAIVSLVGFFLHFAKLTNIVLFSPSSHSWVFLDPPRHPNPGQPSIPDKLSTIIRIARCGKTVTIARTASSLRLRPHRSLR